MIFKNIDFKSGVIVHDDFNLDLEKSIDEQGYLDEDLLQVKYPKGYTLDLGWYINNETKGAFILNIIKDCDWDNPIYKRTTKNLKQLEELIKESIELVEKLTKDDSIESKGNAATKCLH